MHQFDAECAVCQEAQREGIPHDEAMRRMKIREAHMIEQIGWVVHAITDAPLAHTHGLQETYGHPDFEVRLPVAPRRRYDLLRTLAEAVQAGQTFHAGVESLTPFQCPVRFVERQEDDRTVLRAVFPDANGRWPGESGCQTGYNEQLLD
ncbi:MAG: DUF4262 domain-containing protein [Thermaerobacter sp.]|nr:DUF4262 domain-containing protein [Thermaerobacter sp.]